jgi:hypothetical protein
MIVANHTVVYGNGETALQNTPFDPGKEVAEELLACGAAREPTEAELAAWELVEASKKPAAKKTAKEIKAEEEAAAKAAAAEAEAAAKEAEEAAAKAAADADKDLLL